ncbi:hypothetical protein SPRG_13687 [Saprolegnia parasitica CBS 223.65]|uniref:Clusterin-associated protein 1 n=1 Tax=Saprolegnia parasitica (strain CBS 223.65) TaxID=695850 RepID=A0A067BS83_SAPPC|nr:hypothetical protein SPRG_13687 [Saprolegnia parasitica CBS 223.65]KDO21374.1 hypothetical protein SPRG_13687 [Saprolegnia parasitica CBS 223.65]|eukprot:XP_012207930.1 hypothetical protein SPRG_13687 [Saprolegnia parasitica CBS 223.65]
MSFRELRNLTEMMRALGYPRPVSVENFRTPNFELVSDLLYWMAKKYDPSSSVTEEIDTEEDRIAFLTSVTSEFFNKARIRLNPKKLYAADGFAVKELLKVAKVLYEASRIDPSSLETDDDDLSTKSLLGSKLKDAKATRALSAEITDCGAKLFDLLENELDVREARSNALRFLDTHKFLEKSIKELIAGVSENVESMERQCAELDAEEKALSAKIKKAQGDLERSEKRLKSLQNVRPAFMDEYEKLEKELERQYAIYCERFRNLDYLQRELDLHNDRELKKLQENDRTLKKMQKKFRDDELAILRGEQEEPGDAPLPSSDHDTKSNQQQQSSMSKASKDQPDGRRKSKANANVNSSESEDESEDDESEDDDDVPAAVTKSSAAAKATKGSEDDESEDEVSVADSIDNDDESGSGSEVESNGSKSGSGASESGSESDPDF